MFNYVVNYCCVHLVPWILDLSKIVVHFINQSYFEKNWACVIMLFVCCDR